MDGFLIFLLVLCILVWMFALFDLMRRPEDDFRGANDRLAWAIILTFTFGFGTIVYFVCRFLDRRPVFSAPPVADRKPAPKRESEPGIARPPWESETPEATARSDDGLKCMECGATIADDATACPACGWTWASD